MQNAIPVESVIQRLHQEIGNFSKQQKRIAEFILENFEEVAFMSLPEISKKLEVGEATVIRLAKAIGLSGYQEMRSCLQETLKDTITPSVKITQTSENFKERSVLEEAIAMDIATLSQARSQLSPELFATSVEALCQAKRVFVLGLGVSASIAVFIDHRLRRCGIDSRLLDTGGRIMAERVATINESDVLLAIGFYRCQDEVLMAADYATRKGAHTIAITDSPVSSLGRCCQTVLPAKRGPVKVLTSPVVPMAVANALTVAVALQYQEKSKGILKIVEDLYEKR